MDGQAGMGSILGALGSTVEGLGGLVGEVASSLTGSDALGDLAGAAVNVLTGNLPGAVAEGLSFGRDLVENPCGPFGPGGPGPGTLATGAAAGAGATGGFTPATPLTGADAAATAPPPVTRRDPGRAGAHGTSKAAPTPGFASRALGKAKAAKEGAPAKKATPRGHPAKGKDHPAHPAGGKDHPPHPAGDTGHPGGLSGSTEAILGNQALPIEEQVALLLSTLVDGLDGQIHNEMGQLARAQSGSSKGKGSGDVQQMQTQLQMLVQRRGQMLTLLSNLEGLFNQTSMQVISNIR